MDSSKNIDDILTDLQKPDAEIQQTVLRKQLQNLVNELLVNNFPALLQVLYRIDVSEKKLRQLLHTQPETDAAIIITDLIIERQLQKVTSRQKFSPPSNESKDERW